MDTLFQVWTGAKSGSTPAAMTALGITVAAGNFALSSVFLVQEVMDLVNTLQTFRKETEVLKRALKEKLDLVEYGKCRVVKEMSTAHKAIGVPDSAGRTLADRAIHSVKETLSSIAEPLK